MINQLTRFVPRAFVRAGSVGMLLGLLGAAQPARPTVAPRKPAGVSAAQDAAIFRRPYRELEWKVAAQGQKLLAGDLLVGLPGALVDSLNGAVRLSLQADLDQLSPFPIKEAAVSLHNVKNFDLAFTLDRGRVDITNRKKSGSAAVRVTVHGEPWEIVLTKPGSSLALELYGRWPRGSVFKKEADAKNAPIAEMMLLALQGSVSIKHAGSEHTLRAPPGPALLEWDSVTGVDDAPQHLDKLPVWAAASESDTPLARARKATLERLRKDLQSKPIDQVIDEYVNSTDPALRRGAIILMGALDQLGSLGKALHTTKYPDVWENGVLVLRHWIGRKPGQDQVLYKRLIEVGKMKPVQAETILQLLHSYGDEELSMPETYQTLIDYLNHDSLAIRGLSYWHLIRLVPSGLKIGYNPFASKEKRAAAVEEWRKLVPPGKVPPRRPAPTEKKK